MTQVGLYGMLSFKRPINPSLKETRMSNLHIFVNGKKKEESDGVANPMTIDAVAQLVQLTATTATVRLELGESGKAGDPLSGSIDIKNGMHFLVTRNGVNGGSL